MKKIIVSAWVLAATLMVAQAQIQTFNDRYGRPVARAQQHPSGWTSFTDMSGRSLGNSYQNGPMTRFSSPNGMPSGSAMRQGSTTTFTDALGMPRGSARSYGPNTQVSDRFGRPTYNINQGCGGTRYITDRQGRPAGKISSW